MRKDVHMKRHKCTNSEREYVRGIVHNLSFQRWTDKDIAKFLNEEKKIEVSRSTVSRMRNQVERNAEKWYIQLRQSRYKYIAMYKERIDSLFSYQKKLNQIVDTYLCHGDIINTDSIIRAIAELHRIEMSVFSLWKQLPDLQIDDTNTQLAEPTAEENKLPYINICDIMPEDRSKIMPVSLCRCRTEIEHFACYKCMRGFCRPIESMVDGIVKCPHCNSVVNEPHNSEWV